MKNFTKSLISAAAIAVLASVPLAASAYSIGVSDELDSSILSGHVTQNSADWSSASGNTWSNSSATKNGEANDTGTNNGSVVDPATSATSINGGYGETVTTTAGSKGTYTTGSYTSKYLTGAQEVDTDLNSNVSTYFNP